MQIIAVYSGFLRLKMCLAHSKSWRNVKYYYCQSFIIKEFIERLGRLTHQLCWKGWTAEGRKKQRVNAGGERSGQELLVGMSLPALAPQWGADGQSSERLASGILWTQPTAGWPKAGSCQDISRIYTGHREIDLPHWESTKEPTEVVAQHGAERWGKMQNQEISKPVRLLFGSLPL